MIQIKDGCFAYPGHPQILKDINFSLDNGEILTILGQNGIGKTTLLKCLTGILHWTSGASYIDGQKIETTKDFKGLGYVPQAHPLSFSYTVRDIVMMGRAKYIHVFGIPSKQDREKADEAMEDVGIQDIADQSCTTLSGGQLQLAFIARALVEDPTVLILDEPESHLDFKNQFLILKLISDLSHRKNLSCIINTHFPDHALMISDKTLMLGRQKYLFGESSDIIREDHISEFFHIKSRIVEVPDDLDHRKAFVVLDTV